MYDEWFVERLKLTVDPNVGSWSFSTWVDDEEAGGAIADDVSFPMDSYVGTLRVTACDQHLCSAHAVGRRNATLRCAFFSGMGAK